MTARAQMWQRLGTDNSLIDTTATRTLSACVDAMPFFCDNEFDGSKLTNGYTLPGMWLRPYVQYNPVGNVHLELGFNALVYDGANKYPNYAYHDIGTWKGEQYQSGAHVLPWLRACMQVGDVTFVLGNIYGAQNHHFSTPMYNDEQLLSADPEAGFQILYRQRRFDLDAFINWQSYIFKEDTHQEAFTVGVASRILWNAPSAAYHLYSPVQILLQHRGGEQDKTDLGVQTVCNGSIGIAMHHTPETGTKTTAVDAAAELLGCYQQAGRLWRFDSGMALHACASVTLRRDFTVKAGYFCAPKQYVSIYGLPFFGTQSLTDRDLSLRGIHTAYAGTEYSHTFARHYTLGANFQAYSVNSRGLSEFRFQFGVYMRLRPSFVIHRFR